MWFVSSYIRSIMILQNLLPLFEARAFPNFKQKGVYSSVLDQTSLLASACTQVQVTTLDTEKYVTELPEVLYLITVTVVVEVGKYM